MYSEPHLMRPEDYGLRNAVHCDDWFEGATALGLIRLVIEIDRHHLELGRRHLDDSGRRELGHAATALPILEDLLSDIRSTEVDAAEADLGPTVSEAVAIVERRAA